MAGDVLGRTAAEAALAGRQEGSIAITRTSNSPYEVKYDILALEDVAAKTRTLPPEYIAGHCDIAPAFREYAEPLVGPLPMIDGF